jgi:hypothetical protein
MMDRMQIYLETEQRLRLNALSRALRRPTAELIRDAVDRYLAEQSQSVSPNDPLFELIGAAGSLETATDVASNHQKYLALAEPAGPRYSRAAQKARAEKTLRKRRGRGP